MIAACGMIIASAALFIVLSVFTGLKDYSLEFSSFVDPDLKLIPATGKSFDFSDDDLQKLDGIDGIDLVSKIVEERIIIKSNNKNLLATLKGVDRKYRSVTQIDSMVNQGNWLIPETDQVVSGWGISNNLSFGVFDFRKPLTLYVPKPGKGQFSSLKSVYNSVLVTNVGLFNINEELNNEYVFSDIGLAQQLLNYKPDQISAIELKLNNSSNENSVREAIASAFKDKFLIKNRAQLNDALFKMLNTENLAVYLIFTLVIIIALFNVIGALIMMILDKKASLNTLFNLGLDTKAIRTIFFIQGSLLTVISGLTGVTIGILIVLAQQQFDLIMLTASLPYPVRMTFGNVFLVLLTITLFGIIASRIASSRITKKLVCT